MFVFILEVLNEDSHGAPGRNPGPLAFFNVSKKPTSPPKKAAVASMVPAPTPPVSYSGAPLPGLRVGGEPAVPKARGTKTKNILKKQGLSRGARVAIRAAVASNPSHPEAESLYPPVGASKLDDLIPAALRVRNAARPGAEPALVESRSPMPVPGPARADSWFDSDRGASVSLLPPRRQPLDS